MIKKIKHYQSLNAIRLFLASLVAWSHSYPLSGGGEDPLTTAKGVISGGAIAVYAFFIISGFLVSKSWLARKNVPIFIMSRFFRIWPTLAAAICMSIAIACYVSTAAPIDFIKGAITFICRNMVLLLGVAYQIPGVFDVNPVSKSVNGSLWTLPWEVRSYLALLCFAILGGFKRRSLANLMITLGIILFIWTSQEYGRIPFYDNITVPFMLGAFLVGIMFSINEEFLDIKYILIFLVVGIFLFSNNEFYIRGWGCIIILSCIIALLSFKPIFRIRDIGIDISYGVYVYAFPIQQLIVWLNPKIAPNDLFLTAIPVVFSISLLSWKIIESPAIDYSIRIKKKYYE